MLSQKLRNAIFQFLCWGAAAEDLQRDAARQSAQVPEAIPVASLQATRARQYRQQTCTASQMKRRTTQAN